MAQRTGAERFLTPAVKSASAGVALALAGAALALAGCGGGSSAPQASTGSSTGAVVAGAGGQQGAGAAPASEEGEGSSSSRSKAGGADTSTSASTSPSGAAASTGKGQKHGPRIAPPKGPREQAPTPEEVAKATVADMSLQSPAVLAADGHLGRLDAAYTCDGKDSWPEFHWGAVPAGTAELALFAMNVQPVKEQIFFDWAVAGLGPELEGIQAGRLPKGAVVGTNSFGKAGYSLCPPGAGETYMFAVYALPRHLGLGRGFDAATARQAVLDASGDVGLLPAVYERG